MHYSFLSLLLLFFCFSSHAAYNPFNPDAYQPLIIYPTLPGKGNPPDKQHVSPASPLPIEIAVAQQRHEQLARKLTHLGKQNAQKRMKAQQKKKQTHANSLTPPLSPDNKQKIKSTERIFKCEEDPEKCTASFYRYADLKSHCSISHRNKKLPTPMTCSICAKQRKGKPRTFRYKSLAHEGLCALINAELTAINKRDSKIKKQKKAAAKQQMTLIAQVPK